MTKQLNLKENEDYANVMFAIEVLRAVQSRLERTIEAFHCGDGCDAGSALEDCIAHLEKEIGD
jgi:hypothetical protein